jgi:hypothetical protein
MPTTPIPTLVSRGTMLEELDRLELGPDPANAWDDAWLDDDGELSAAPGWEAWGLLGAPAPSWKAICSPNRRGVDRRTDVRQSRVEAAGRQVGATLDCLPTTTPANTHRVCCLTAGNREAGEDHAAGSSHDGPAETVPAERSWP